MKFSFESRLASRIINFIEQKRALGFLYYNEERCLYFFDKHCVNNFPDEDNLTKEICMSWAIKYDTEGNSSFRNRLAPVREFAKYLNGVGELAHIITDKYGKSRIRTIPYIYSESEIASIWNELDCTESSYMYPLRHLVIPAFVRLLYCCGLRPCEAFRLTTNDVDLEAGKIYIRESKGHKDRLIMLADDVKDYYLNYNTLMSQKMSGRRFFFSETIDKPFPQDVIRYQFKLTRTKLGFSTVGTTTPRLYDFRHTFATHRLYRWLQEGKDLNVMMPYLRAYMGHAELKATYYYIHLIPEQLKVMSGMDFSRYEGLLPEVEINE